MSTSSPPPLAFVAPLNADSLQACNTTLFQWSGGSAPYNLSFTPSDSLYPILGFVKLQQETFSVKLPYPKGTRVIAQVNSSTTSQANITINITSVTPGCLLTPLPSPPSTLPATQGGAPSLSIDAGQTCVPSTNITINGGLPPFDVSLQDLDSSLMLTYLALPWKNLTKLALPSPKNDRLQVTVSGVRGSSSTSQLFRMNLGGNAGCLLADPQISSTDSTEKGKSINIGIIIGPVVGATVLLAVLGFTFFYIRKRKSRRRRKQRIFEREGVLSPMLSPTSLSQMIAAESVEPFMLVSGDGGGGDSSRIGMKGQRRNFDPSPQTTQISTSHLSTSRDARSSSRTNTEISASSPLSSPPLSHNHAISSILPRQRSVEGEGETEEELPIQEIYHQDAGRVRVVQYPPAYQERFRDEGGDGGSDG